MNVFKVNSLPLQEVIESLAESLQVPYVENCKEYFVNIPLTYGEGQIRAISFDNGLGIIVYKCKFLEDLRIEFTVDNVHPIKYIYAVQGPVKHSFANDPTEHVIEQYKCAIVASEKNNGHVLSFEKDTELEIISLEIDREKFLVNTICEIKSLASKLQALFKDTKAEITFYHEGFFGLEFKNLLSDITKYKDQKLVRKFYLESLALQIFVNQLVQFDDDLLQDEDRMILRVNELKRLEDITLYIEDNLSHDLTVTYLSKKTGLNPNKLQAAFKHLFHATVNEYVTNKKLERALALLRNKELTVGDVASRIGFDNNSYFSKIFKRKYGMSPNSYRQL